MTQTQRVVVYFFAIVIGLWAIRKELFRGESEYRISGIKVNKNLYINVVNEIYGAAVDSVKTCECLLPKFYDVIKDDRYQVEQLRQTEVFQLDTAYYGKFQDVFVDCVLRNIVDTNAKMKLSGPYQVVVEREMNAGFDKLQLPTIVDRKSLISCIVQKLDNKLTIKEYLEGKDEIIERFRDMILACTEAAKVE